MKKTRGFLLAVLSILTAGFCTLGVTGCDDDSVSGTDATNSDSTEITVWTMESVYAKAQELGYTGSLEEFIASVSGIDGENGKDGKDGVNGVGIEEIYINAEGHLLVKLTGQATHTDLGKVVGEDGDLKIENEQGLDFYLKDDGTYGVKAGTASYLTEITIPATYKGRAVTEVLNYFFGTEEENGRALVQKIVIPDSVTSIADYAFLYCRNLTSVTIGDSVTSIGDYAFSYCSSLTSITMGDSITSIGNGAFSACTSLTSITMGDSITSIGDRAFFYCYNLTSITIPDSVTSIGDYAFSGCSSLTNITFNGTVEEWYEVEIYYNWYDDIPATVVVCSDGEVAL